MKKLFDGIYSDGKKIYTKNLTPGKRVYGERLVKEGSAEYREWDAHRSKYCAAVKKGLKQNIFFEGTSVLYLGSAEGTTISHVSDIIWERGVVIGVDISEIAMIKLMKLAEERGNILPILSDAQETKGYEDIILKEMGGADTLFQDISQRNQAEIFLRNSIFLKKGSLGALTLKTKSISQFKEKKEILAQETKKLAEEFEILQTIDLEPYEKEHYLILVKKK